jgi:1,4-dihydroxy-6-naphthoate synthase
MDIAKLSYPAFFQNINKYVLLNSGAALGKGVGPLLISKFKIENEKDQIEKKTVVLPGKNTTANLLFSLAFPQATKKRFMVFSAIEDAVLNEETDLGVIIHENRFTYHLKGLKKVLDLGEYWEEKMKLPIPLGGIAIKRTVDKTISLKVDKLIRKSLEFSFANYPLITDYVKQHSQEMSEDVMRQHIELYVNNFSIDLGADGKEAIGVLYNIYKEMNNLPNHSSENLFL